MTAQGNALGNKSVTMTHALKGRNRIFIPTNRGKSLALTGLASFVSYGSQGVALGLSVTAPLGQIVSSSSGSSPAGCVTDPFAPTALVAPCLRAPFAIRYSPFRIRPVPHHDTMRKNCTRKTNLFDALA